jgi:hypothetical protein
LQFSEFFRKRSEPRAGGADEIFQESQIGLRRPRHDLWFDRREIHQMLRTTDVKVELLPKSRVTQAVVLEHSRPRLIKTSLQEMTHGIKKPNADGADRFRPLIGSKS